jgi:putative ABC transport system substrate-binding protein
MNRRRFLLTSLAGAFAAPLAAAGQTRVYRVAFLAQGSPPTPGQPQYFRPALRELGYVEGQNLMLEFRYAEGKNERFPGLAADLVALKPDVIVADSTPAALATKRATTTIPIVFVNVSDPVGTGIVESLTRSGGNITGVTDFGTALVVKQLNLLQELLPKKSSRIAVLMSANPVHPLQLKLI